MTPVVDVFGTDRFSGEDLLAAYPDEFEAIVAYARGDTTRFTPEVRSRLEDELRLLGEFAWMDMAVVVYPRQDEWLVNITLDVVERADSARRMAFSSPPTDTLPDPGALLKTWKEYEAKAFGLLRAGELPSRVGPCSAHHCFLGFSHDSLAAYGELFSTEVPPRVDALTRVLRRDADPRKRKSAAYLLAHAKEAQEVVDALLPAISDPDDGVRNAVLRVFGALTDDPELDVPLDPFLRALDYPATTDRNKAGIVLLHLAERPAHRERILREAGPILLEMLALRQPNNHDPAIRILRRLSGKELDEWDVEAWRRWWTEETGLEPSSGGV